MMMKSRFLRRSAGTSIIDVLVGLLLSVISMGIVYNFYVVTKMTWLYSVSQSDMQRNAMLGMEKIIHGVDAAHKGVTEARDLFVPVQNSFGDVIQFEDSDAPGVVRSFYLQGDKIVYMDENNNISDIIGSDVQSLTFTRPNGRDNLVLIDFILQRTVLDKDITVEMSTAVELRNFFDG